MGLLVYLGYKLSLGASTLLHRHHESQAIVSKPEPTYCRYGGSPYPYTSTCPVECAGSLPILPSGPMGGRQSAEVEYDVEGHILHRICLVTVRLFSSLLSCLWPTKSNKHSSPLLQPLAFPFPFLPLVASPARTLCAEIPPSLALHTPARVHTLRQLLFALLLTHDHRACTHSSFTSGRSCFVRRRCCGALRAKRGVFLGTQSSAGVCVCVCVSVQSLWYSSHMK